MFTVAHMSTHTNTHLHQQAAYGVVCQYLLASDGDLKGAERLISTVRPVLLVLGLPSLLEVSDHHNSGGPLLPHQMPEVHQCLWQGTWKGSSVYILYVATYKYLDLYVYINNKYII